jgi:hypothetical protein
LRSTWSTKPKSSSRKAAIEDSDEDHAKVARKTRGGRYDLTNIATTKTPKDRPRNKSKGCSHEALSRGAGKGYRSTVKDAYTPLIRAALVKATPLLRARFEEKYGPAVRECGVVHSEERITVRRIEVDGSVTTFVVEGEAAQDTSEGNRRIGENV